jgi:predicted dehydrogenase
MGRTFSVLVVGAGSIGERHARCFLASGRAEISICEVNKDLAATVAARYGIRHVYHDMQAALEPGPDVTVICTPAHLHVSQAMLAVRANSHVLIEKPLSTDLTGIAELTSAAREQGRVCGVAYVYRANPVLAEMREALFSEAFGKPLQLTAVAGQHFPFYRPAYRETYYRDHRTGGGAVQDALTHIINAAEWLVGPVESVVADLEHMLLAGVEVEDTVHVLARHGGLMGCYSLNQHQAPNETSITVVCERGTVRFEAHTNQWRSCAEFGGPWTDHKGAPLERDTLFTRQANAFLDAVEGKAQPLCSVSQARQTLSVNLAILDSAAHREWRRITPEELSE